MRSSVWVSLIRIFPPEVLEKLMAVMTSGNEINISGVLRFEQDFMVVRGRLAGTTDDASVVFLPYDQIDYMGIRVPMKDSELEAIFVNSGYQSPPAEVHAAPVYAPPSAPLPPAPSLAPVTRIMPAPQPTPVAPISRPTLSAPPTPLAPEPVPEPTVPAAAAAAAGTPASAILPGKAALLERLRRSRLNQEGPKSSEGK